MRVPYVRWTCHDVCLEERPSAWGVDASILVNIGMETYRHRYSLGLTIPLLPSHEMVSTNKRSGIVDQPTGDPKTLWDAIIADVETRQLAREFDNTDCSNGQNLPSAQQCADAAAIMAKARELRRILRS